MRRRGGKVMDDIARVTAETEVTPSNGLPAA